MAVEYKFDANNLKQSRDARQWTQEDAAFACDEMSVSTLHGRMLLSQSALSQHLARLRKEGLVAYRREAQTLFYRVADERALRLLGVLHELYCPELEPERKS